MPRIGFKTLSPAQKALLIQMATQAIVAVGRDNTHIPEQPVSTKPFTPIDIDDALGRYYLDGEDSVLCPICAEESNVETEVPHFRPKRAQINTNDPTVYCDNCSEYIDPVEPPESVD
jgi:hypothetical protein